MRRFFLQTKRVVTGRQAKVLIKGNQQQGKQLVTRKYFHNNQNNYQTSQEKVNFDKMPSTSSYITIGSCALIGIVVLSEINYYIMPDLSFGNAWRKLVFGNPFRNYENMIRGKVMYLALPKEYQIPETVAEQVGDQSLISTENERVIYISLERKFHLIIPKNFVPLGLTITEHNSNIRGYTSFSAKDIIGNQLNVEWQRASQLFAQTQLSIYTPMQDALQHIAHFSLDKLNESVDNLHVQRIEYLTSKKQADMGTDANSNQTIPKELDPVPFFKEKNLQHQDLLIVVTKATKDHKINWQGHMFSIEYPYVYHISLDLPEQVVAFGESHRDRPVTESELNEVARRVSKVNSLQQVIKGNFKYAPSDPKDISKLLRNQLLAIHYNSFFTVPEKI
jgi:hypothetical protein